jgi:hypothetical protein
MWQIFLYFYFIKKFIKTHLHYLQHLVYQSSWKIQKIKKIPSLSPSHQHLHQFSWKIQKIKKFPPSLFFIKDLFFKRISFFPTIQTQIKSTLSSNKNTTLSSYTNFSIIKKQNCCFVCPYRTSFLCLSCATTKKTKL